MISESVMPVFCWTDGDESKKYPIVLHVDKELLIQR